MFANNAMERKMDYYLIPFLSLAQIPVHLSITYDEVSFRVKIFNLLVFVHLDYYYYHHI